MSVRTTVLLSFRVAPSRSSPSIGLTLFRPPRSALVLEELSIRLCRDQWWSTSYGGFQGELMISSLCFKKAQKRQRSQSPPIKVAPWLTSTLLAAVSCKVMVKWAALESFKVVGGQHRLRNYFSTTTLHRTMIDGCPSTIVIESYVVDVPEGNTREETRVFADTIVRSNLQSLARTSELLVRNARNLVFLE
ncbi:hypothetical protein GOP47_0028392 [Adiantum capillus-veneris]|nr:hypothetical protein GOP47_0028392 [Adiantum capillus-veneris]